MLGGCLFEFAPSSVSSFPLYGQFARKMRRSQDVSETLVVSLELEGSEEFIPAGLLFGQPLQTADERALRKSTIGLEEIVVDSRSEVEQICWKLIGQSRGEA
jgi:hypothetical protein